MSPAGLHFPTKPSPSPLPYLTTASRLSPALSPSCGPSPPPHLLPVAQVSEGSEASQNTAGPQSLQGPARHRYRGPTDTPPPRPHPRHYGLHSSYDPFNLMTEAELDADLDDIHRTLSPTLDTPPPTAVTTASVSPTTTLLPSASASTSASVSSSSEAATTPTTRLAFLPSLHAAAVTNSGLQRTFSRHSTSTTTSSPASASASVCASASASASAPNSTSAFTSSQILIASASPSLPSAASTRRKSLLLNLSVSDPTMPGPGELVTSPNTSRRPSVSVHSPGHAPLGSPVLPVPDQNQKLSQSRTTSLGEIHQELEVEQEAQVNRLLGMIRQQQLELQRLQALQSHNNNTSDNSAAIDESAIASPLPATTSPVGVSRPAGINHSLSPTTQQQPAQGQIPRSSFDLVRADIQHRRRNSSIEASPRMRPPSISGGTEHGYGLGFGSASSAMAARDDSSFYQAETQIMMRENQMLRHRIRELEKQVADMAAASPTTANQNLTRRSSLVHVFATDV
ncbi:hypothetical protein Cpir12675_003026 [Ceratocystis pirilliformis]|uniref:Uncharacterized protein n=1 Tax=Ceratocystis pirilliformis TaxID=259994 RepID=A0ABR3Z5T6_9PEZI